MWVCCYIPVGKITRWNKMSILFQIRRQMALIRPLLTLTFVTQTIRHTTTDQTGEAALLDLRHMSVSFENPPIPRFRSRRQASRGKELLSHLADLCPYANICDRQGRELPSTSSASCCLPCSCDSTCTKIGNCCKRSKNAGFMCYSPELRQSKSHETVDTGYFMVDECLDQSIQDCKAEAVAPWGSFYPVYDPDLELNFYNQRCAECSGATNLTNWDLTVICDRNIDAYFLDVLRGKLSQDCYIKFTPPNEMIEMKHICNSGTTGHCNATGRWKVHNSTLERACSRFYSPVVWGLMGRLMYTNIFCQQCNEDLKMSSEDLCTPPTLQKTTGPTSFTLAIDYRQVSPLVDKRLVVVKPDKDGQCPKGTVKPIQSTEHHVCRTILCPNGFIRSGTKCMPLLLNTLNDGYEIQLLLTPSTELLPFSYLETLTYRQRHVPTTWFKSEGVPLKNFILRVKKVTVETTVFIESLIIWLGIDKGLNNEFQHLEDAMKKPWTITLNNTRFEFIVSFYRYALFVPMMGSLWENVLKKITPNFTRGDWFKMVRQEEAYESVVIKSTTTVGGQLFTLKKTNFCNRVRLSRSEWIAGFQEIRLNISGGVVDSNKTLGDSEFDIFLDDQGEPIVEICVEDYQEQMVTKTSYGNVLGANWVLIYMKAAGLILSSVFEKN